MEKNIPTIVTGGTIVETTSTLIGPIAVEAIRTMAFDRVFLGATGVSEHHGFSNSNLYEAEIKRHAIRRGTEVNIVLDHTKFGAHQLVSFGELTTANRIITDINPDSDLLEACRQASLEILIS
jgi:DeoR/GlpR family transcriptional regulator of sugar metabolism